MYVAPLIGVWEYPKYWVIPETSGLPEISGNTRNSGFTRNIGYYPLPDDFQNWIRVGSGIERICYVFCICWQIHIRGTNPLSWGSTKLNQDFANLNWPGSLSSPISRKCAKHLTQNCKIRKSPQSENFWGAHDNVGSAGCSVEVNKGLRKKTFSNGFYPKKRGESRRIRFFLSENFLWIFWPKGEW